MNWRQLAGHWFLASARRHELKAIRLKRKAEKLFRRVKRGHK